MNAASLARFSGASAKTAQALRGSSVTIGETTYEDVPVFHSGTTVENDRGGNTAIRTMVIHLSREAVPTAPAVGTRITDEATGITGEIYEIAGRGLPYHILRAASRPDKSA